jgi:PAS domain S-box-containing protein
MIYIALINNITLLVCLSILHSFLVNRWRLSAIQFQVFSGTLFGLVAIIGMFNSLEVTPGVFFDGRSIILVTAGIFGGPVPAAIAAVISGSYRLYVGGPGAIMGVLVILQAGFFGTLLHSYRKKHRWASLPITYYLTGLLIHCNLLILSITLPGGLRLEVLPQIVFPVLLIYPIGTLLVAWLFQFQEHHVKTVENLQESEAGFRQVFQNSQAVYLLVDPDDGAIKDANQAAVSFYGWPLPVLKSMKMEQINLLPREEILQLMGKARSGLQRHFQFRHRRSDGDIREVEVLSGPVTINGNTLLLSTVQDVTEKKQAADQLKREHLLLRTVIDNIPDRVSVKDENGRYLLANLSDQRFHGLPEARLSGKTESELFPTPSGKQAEHEDMEVIHTGRAVINKEERVPGKNGQTAWMLSTKIPLRNEQNQSIGLVSITRDNTQRKDFEEQIRSLSLVAEKTSNLVSISDDNDQIMWANHSFLEATGYTMDEVIGRSVASLLRGPETDPGHIRIFAEKIAKKEAFKQEILNYTKDGRKIWLEVYVNPVLDKHGAIEKVVAISVDITERKQSELRLHQSIQSYSDLFNSFNEGIYIQDAQGRFLDVNEGAMKMYGYSLEEIVGKTPDFLAAPGRNDMESLMKAITEAYNGTPQELEFWALTNDGRVFPKEVHLYPGEYFSKRVVLAIGQDISQRKQTEELKNKLVVARNTAQLKQQFLANMSHEMRTPMNGVLGMAEVLKKTTLDPTQKKYLRVIEESSRSLLDIINDVLHLSKIESGKETLHERILHSHDFMHRIDALFSEIARNKGLGFDISCDERVPPSILVDENKLLQVINNLVGNAIKFTSKGSVSLRCKLLTDPAGNKLRVEVKDTGEGIDPEHHEHIFDEFAQADASRTRETGGTGLGLAISKRIVAMLGGEIGVQSEPGKGSTFWFTFNFKEANGNAGNGSSDNYTDTGNGNLPKNAFLDISVLLVEDKKVNQMVARLILQDMGCRVDLAENGKIAIEKITESKYDVVLMDIQMPVMDGITAVKELRKMNRPLPPIIGLSAEAMEGDAEKYIALGMDDYITKPIDTALLFSKLKRLISNQVRP